MFPISGMIQTPSGGDGGGVTPSTGLTETQIRAIITGYNYLTSSDSPSATQVKAWVRGGMFRSLKTIYEDHTFDDTTWQSLLSTPYLVGTTVYLRVQQPTSDLGFQPVSPADMDGWSVNNVPPAGAWTVITNPNNTAPVYISFPETVTGVTGWDGPNNRAIAANTPVDFQLPQRRMAFLQWRGNRQYYLSIW